MTIQFKKISELFSEIKIGGTPSRGNPNYFGGTNLWVSIKDMNGQPIITRSAECITDEGVANSNCKLITKGSLLFSFKLTVGRVAFAGANLYTNEAIAAFDANEANMSGIDLEYLSLVLPIAALSDTTKNSMGAPLLNKDKIGELIIPFPIISEQRQIAAKLKVQLAEVEKAQKSAQEQLRDVKILHYRTLELLFAELDSTPKYKIGDFAETTSGSTPSRSQKNYWEPSEIPWIKTGEVAFLPITMSEEYISKKALKECSIKLLPVDTVLVAMYGQGKTRGQSAILKMEATINQACFAILPNDTWEPEFLYLWLRYSYQNLRDLSDDRGGNQANLNGALMKAFEVPAPTKTKQREIVNKINFALNEIDIIKERCKESIKDIKSLPNHLLTNAFNK